MIVGRTRHPGADDEVDDALGGERAGAGAAAEPGEEGGEPARVGDSDGDGCCSESYFPRGTGGSGVGQSGARAGAHCMPLGNGRKQIGQASEEGSPSVESDELPLTRPDAASHTCSGRGLGDSDPEPAPRVAQPRRRAAAAWFPLAAVTGLDE